MEFATRKGDCPRVLDVTTLDSHWLAASPVDGFLLLLGGVLNATEARDSTTAEEQGNGHPLVLASVVDVHWSRIT